MLSMGHTYASDAETRMPKNELSTETIPDPRAPNTARIDKIITAMYQINKIIKNINAKTNTLPPTLSFA